MRPRQDGHHFADNIFKFIFLNENVWIPIKISLKFVPNGPINKIPAMVQIMAWRRPADKPLSEPMVVSLPMHICVARPRWVQIKSREISFWKFAENTAVILPCSELIGKTIRQLVDICGNWILFSFSFRWDSDGCHILHIFPTMSKNCYGKTMYSKIP